jgi:hypothetical protein
MSKKSPGRTEVEDGDPNAPLLSRGPVLVREVPKFKPPRKIEAWGHRDVMPMHKTNLAARQEKSKEQLCQSFDEAGNELMEERPDWYGRNPAQALPQKAPAFPPAQPVPPVKRNPYTTAVPGLNPPVSPLTRRQSRLNSNGSGGLGGATAADVDQVLSAEAQMELAGLLGAMLSTELGEDEVGLVGPDDVKEESHPSSAWVDANPPGNDTLLSELRRWRTPQGAARDETVPDAPDSGSGNFPKDDRDAAGDISGRLSWVPSLYARSDLLSKESSRAFLDYFEESHNEEASMAAPNGLTLPAIAPANKVSYKVGDTMRKKWQGYAAMSEHGHS